MLKKTSKRSGSWLRRDIQVLKKHFSHCFDKNGVLDIEKFKKKLSTDPIDFCRNSCRLDWLGKSYAKILTRDNVQTLLVDDEDFNKKDTNKWAKNLLIRGDNLEVLKHLVNCYNGGIKMIYIDPPYNTGHDAFVYQDKRQWTLETFQDLSRLSRERAKRVLDFTKGKHNSHSAWLTFMYPRLFIAKHLLKDDGVIFISIDDNEVSQLRLLMNEIFGENNCVSQFVWQRAYAPNNMNKHFSRNHDFIVCYAKNIDALKPFFLEKIQIENKDDPFSQQRQRKSQLLRTVWTHNEVGHTQRAFRELKNLFDGEVVFSYPKPLSLIRRLCQMATGPGDIVLDFFAGSGTTGQAVLEENARDGGHRQFILVQLPEKINVKKNKDSHNFVKKSLNVSSPTIFEITKERLIRSLKKISSQRGGETSFKHGFKIFKTVPRSTAFRADLGKSFRENRRVRALLFTWKTFDGSPLTEKWALCDLMGYVCYVVNQHFYLMHKGFLGSQLPLLCEKIDEKPLFLSQSIVVREDYFDKTILLEMKQKIRAYGEAKGRKIAFITRSER